MPAVSDSSGVAGCQTSSRWYSAAQVGQQRVDPDGGEVGKGVRDRVWQHDEVAVPQGTAGIDHVRHVTFAFGGLGPDQRLARARQHLRGIGLVEQYRADRIAAHGPHSMRQQQPSLVELDGRPAIADLYELPGKLRLENGAAAVPGMQVVRKN